MALRDDIMLILADAEQHPWPPYSKTADRILDLIRQHLRGRFNVVDESLIEDALDDLLCGEDTDD